METEEGHVFQRGVEFEEMIRRRRIFLVLLLVIGICLELGFFYVSIHPNLFGEKIVIGLFLGYLVLTPLFVWRAKGERLLRILLILFWAVSVGVLLYGGYLLEYHDL